MKKKNLSWPLAALVGFASLITPFQGECSTHRDCVGNKCKDRSKDSDCTTCAPTKITKPTTICKPGAYCLTQNIDGPILIESDDVTLDLNSHRVDGNGAPAAIYSEGYNNLTIRNGAVVNANNLAIGVVNSSGLVIEDVDVYFSNQAIFVANSKNAVVQRISAYSNVNKNNAVVMIHRSNTVDVLQVQVSNNTKSPAATVTPTRPRSVLDPVIGIVTINESTNVNVVDSEICFNLMTNDNTFYAPLAALVSSNIRFVNCMVNNNSFGNNVYSTFGFAPIHTNLCFDVVIEDCQVNRNTMNATSAFLDGIYLVDTYNTVIRNTQVNDNSVTLLDNLDESNNLAGIHLYMTDSTTDTANIITGCQIANNLVSGGGAGRTSFDNLSSLVGIYIETISINTKRRNRTYIDDCQITDNNMATNAPYQAVMGVFVRGASDVEINDTTANANTGGSSAYGFNILSVVGPDGLVLNCSNVRMINCTANDIISTDLAVGFHLGGPAVGEEENKPYLLDCEIINCQANSNLAERGYGITFQNVFSSVVDNTQLNRNTATGFYAGPVVGSIVYDPAPLNRYCSVLNSIANENIENGFELAFDTGVENVYFLIESNTAMGNGNDGFLHSPAVLTSRYLSNFAQNNTFLNYEILGGAIQLFTLNSTGNYNIVTGDDILTHLANIEAVNP